MRRLTRPLLLTAFVPVAAIIALEFILRITDPLGAFKFFAIDVETFYRATVPDATRGYILPEGVYTFSNWSAAVKADNTRFTPAANMDAKCTIAFVGDSITFGMGVNDADVWVNRLAGEYPQARFVNAGVIGYNTAQVLATIRTVSADGYFYTMFDNDADIPLDPANDHIPYSALLVTWRVQFGGGYPETEDWDSFDRAWGEIAAMGNVQTVAFNNAPVGKRAGVPMLPRWQHRKSEVDGHADVVGNAELADIMRGQVGALVGRVC